MTLLDCGPERATAASSTGHAGPPDPKQVAAAVAFLRELRTTKSKAAAINSYSLKHRVERNSFAGIPIGYCSNGAAIQAALDLGIRVEPFDGIGDINARIYVRASDAYGADSKTTKGLSVLELP